MEKWEYKYLSSSQLRREYGKGGYGDSDIEEGLNSLGDEGWELVAVVSEVKGKIQTANPTWVYGDIDTDLTYIFKRRIP